MKGVGGPYLCIGDLLCDVGEDGDTIPGGSQSNPINITNNTNISQLSISDLSNLQPSDLAKLFQESYDQLDKALGSSDQSWTALTLKLCTALETANKVVRYANSNVIVLSEKVVKLKSIIINRRDSAITAVRAVQGSTEPNRVVSRKIAWPDLANAKSIKCYI